MLVLQTVKDIVETTVCHIVGEDWAMPGRHRSYPTDVRPRAVTAHGNSNSHRLLHSLSHTVENNIDDTHQIHHIESAIGQLQPGEHPSQSTHTHCSVRAEPRRVAHGVGVGGRRHAAVVAVQSASASSRRTPAHRRH